MRCIQIFLVILGPHAWTVIGDTFFALNSIGASFDFDRKAYYSSECVEYSISAGKPISRKSIYLGATIKVSTSAMFLILYLLLQIGNIFSMQTTVGLTAVKLICSLMVSWFVVFFC